MESSSIPCGNKLSSVWYEQRGHQKYFQNNGERQ